MLERYPNNGKLRKIYGRFQEYVRNDPWTAGSCYTEAMKQGLNDNLMGLVNGTAGKDSSDKLLLVSQPAVVQSPHMQVAVVACLAYSVLQLREPLVDLPAWCLCFPSSGHWFVMCWYQTLLSACRL